MPSSYALGEHFEQFIKKQIESGRYNSASSLSENLLWVRESRVVNWPYA